jgi:hypothetical protein
MVHLPSRSGPDSGEPAGSHWLKLPATETDRAAGASSASRTERVSWSGSRYPAAQPADRRKKDSMMLHLI